MVGSLIDHTHAHILYGHEYMHENGLPHFFSIINTTSITHTAFIRGANIGENFERSLLGAKESFEVFISQLFDLSIRINIR